MDPDKSTEGKKPVWRNTLMYSFRLSAWIGAPVIVALLLGKALDRWFDTSPWFFLGLTGFGFIVSMVGLIKESRKYIESVAKEEKDTHVGNTTNTTK